MNATLTYRELQTKLGELKAAGYGVRVKLNSKHGVLLAEYQRLTAVLEQEVQAALDSEEKVYTVETLPSITAPAPSWLKKPHTVYWIDNGCGYEQEWLRWELDLWLKQHEGACCNLEVMEELERLTPEAMARDQGDEFDAGAPPSTSDDVPLNYLLLALPIYLLVCCLIPATRLVLKALLATTNKHVESLGSTERRAWSNLKDGTRTAKAFLFG